MPGSQRENLPRMKEGKNRKKSVMVARAIHKIAAVVGGSDAISSLDTVMKQAKSSGVSQETIERVINPNGNKTNSPNVHEVVYDAFGPQGCAFVIEGITDNVNRTCAQVRETLSRHAMQIADQGAARRMFARKGVITVQSSSFNDDETFKLLDIGMEDYHIVGDGTIEVVTLPRQLETIVHFLRQKSVIILQSGLRYIPEQTVVLEGGQTIKEIYDSLRAISDVTGVYTNVAREA